MIGGALYFHPNVLMYETKRINVYTFQFKIPMGKPRFTFCVPNLNKIDFLPACINSILQQDCADWCCVFVDGYSSDSSWEYMQQFNRDPRFKLIRGLRQGMYADWNECLRHVDTEYFYFLTSDDTCYPQLVSTTMMHLDANSDVDVCHFQFAYINEQGLITRSPKEIVQHQFPLYADVNRTPHRRSGLCEFMMHCAYRAPYVTVTSLVFRSRLIQKLEGFSLDYGSSSDYDWTMRMCLETDILYLPKLLATWRIYEGQATSGVRTSSVAKRGLDIAKHNFCAFTDRINGHSNLIKRLNSTQVLAHLSYEYNFRRYKESLKARHLSKAVVSLGQIMFLHPKLLFTHLLFRLTQSDTFNIHQSRTFFAKKLIKIYQLNWPPKELLHDLEG